MRILLTVCGIVALTVSCAMEPERLLPAGTYADADGRFGTLRVEGRFIEFNGKFLDRRSANTAGRYEYRLHKDGYVQIYGSSNSTYFLEVACCWIWDGTAFEYSPDSKRLERTMFRRVDSQ